MDLKRSIGTTGTVLLIVVIAVVGMLGFVYSGLYNVAADDHHTRPVADLMQILRDRSIQAHAQNIKVPDLDDPQLVLKGAGQYAAMCSQCHLEPGMQNSEIRSGLYPQPPNLSTFRPDPREAFWVIKHGIKMSAMPAWGFSHDDATIWSMVAFLQKMPGMTPAQYHDIVARAPPDEDMAMDGAADSAHAHEAPAAPTEPTPPTPAASSGNGPASAASAVQPAAAASAGQE